MNKAELKNEIIQLINENKSLYKAMFFMEWVYYVENKLLILTKENLLKDITPDQAKGILEAEPELNLICFAVKPKFDLVTKEFPKFGASDLPAQLQSCKNIDTVNIDDPAIVESYIAMVQAGKGTMMTKDCEYEGDQCIAPGCWSIIY